jgi:hypothetical protein
MTSLVINYFLHLFAKSKSSLSSEISKVLAGFWWENLSINNHLEELDVDVWIILKYTFKT